MAKAKRRTPSSGRMLRTVGKVWDCARCMDQMLGDLPPGERCWEHNPTPEEREAHPERYSRSKFAGSATLKEDKAPS